MPNFYDIDIIPIILNRFKVNNIVISGIFDKQILNQISKYSDDKNVQCVTLNSNQEENSANYVLNEILALKDYDAIFINNDPNWYTVYNELKIIKSNTSQFPLVFICNNIFPHKRRDSYINPKIIPEEFLNDYSEKLIYHNISIENEFYHAIEENTPKNGVLTAIEDFINENYSIKIMNIEFTNGITILYQENSISQIRIGKLKEEILGLKLNYNNLVDDNIKNQFLVNQISQKYMDAKENSKLKVNNNETSIKKYENQINLHKNELNYKDSQIKSLYSKLDLNNSKIKNFESKLINTETEIDILNNELKIANTQITSLKTELNNKNKVLNNKQNEFNKKMNDANSHINSLKSNIFQKEQNEIKLNKELNNANNQIKLKQKEIEDNVSQLNSIKNQYTVQLSKLDNKEYCISCYKEEITNNHLEIQYLKKYSLIKKILLPFNYIFLILKSNPKELSLNFKLYKSLKNSKCFDIGYYLNNNEDIHDSKWCKYFSPELHYVCYGFNEQRRFNKKYFNRNSKKELLEYIAKCK